jgi:hypothetical protein
MVTIKTITTMLSKPTESSQERTASKMDIINSHPKRLPIIIFKQE